MTFNFLNIGSRVKEAWEYRSEPESMRVIGTFLWRALLILALLVVLFSFWFGVQELGAVSQVENGQPALSTAPPPLDKTQLQSTLADLLARQSEFQTLSQSPTAAVPDPSK